MVCANLIRANLDGANLIRANLDGAISTYVAYSPFLSSRGAALSAGVVVEDGAVQLRFYAGCQRRITAAQLRERMTENSTEWQTKHAAHYENAIAFIERAFEIDTTSGRWNYLLTWHEDHAKQHTE
jgi:hypothetical protein